MSRASTSLQHDKKKDVDGRVEPGHDDGIFAKRRFMDVVTSVPVEHGEHPLVTRKPPKILTEAKVSATKPSARAHSGPSRRPTSATPTASNAPTTMTEEIALVTDISGVCSAGVTDQTT